MKQEQNTPENRQDQSQIPLGPPKEGENKEEKENLKTKPAEAVSPLETPNKNGGEILKPDIKRKKGKAILKIGIVILVLTGLFVGGYFGYKKWKEKSPAPKEEKPVSKEEPAEIGEVRGFATYQEIPVDIEPKIPSYKIEVGLGNITNKDLFYLSDDAKKILEKNAFVVVPGFQNEFFEIYEQNRYNGIANFVTTDSILHNYHLYFDYLLKSVEKGKLISEFKALTRSLYEGSTSQLNELKGTPWENAAKRNQAYFAIISSLLGQNLEVEADLKDVVDAEIDLVDKHKGIALSPLINLGVQNPDPITAYKEDYSQYIPRGHYTKSDDLKRYFKGMMYAGRMTFRLKDNNETRSAILMTLLLNKKENYASWEKIYEPTSFFVGKADDLTFYDYQEVIEKIYSEEVDLGGIQDEAKFAAFWEEAAKLEPPQINSIPIFNEEINPDREAEIKGFRMMGQRFTMDASIFQRLIDRETKDRMLPKGLDVPAAMGSEVAYNILNEMGETKYENYTVNMKKLRDYLKGLDIKTWTQNLYWGWLYTLNPLTDEIPEGYPEFMKSDSWPHKEINTYLGSWTELKHDTILYAKQAYAEMGAGPGEQPDDKGYVEPNPELYARLAALLKMTKEGLAARDLIEARDADGLDKLTNLVMNLKTISEKELKNENLTTEEYEVIKGYGGSLEHFWLETLRDEENQDKKSLLLGNPAAIVADVATDPNGEVLEEATGRVNTIYVAVSMQGKIKLTSGSVYSYYEFIEPLSGRLTDEEWRERLNNNENVPDAPAWTKNFLAEKERI